MAETYSLSMVNYVTFTVLYTFSKGYLSTLKRLHNRSQKVTYPFSKGYILTDKVAYFQVVTPLLNKAHK